MASLTNGIQEMELRILSIEDTVEEIYSLGKENVTSKNKQTYKQT